MKIQSIKCPCCGALLEYEEGKKTIICEFCGTKSVINDISNERTQLNANEQNLINAGNSMLEIQEYNEVKEFFKKAGEIDPTDHRVYAGLIKCATKGFSWFYTPEMMNNEVSEMLLSMYSLDNYTTKIRGIGAETKCEDILEQLEIWIQKNKELLENRISWINSENKEHERQYNVYQQKVEDMFQRNKKKNKITKMFFSLLTVLFSVFLVITGISFLRRCGEGRPWFGMLALSFLIFLAGIFCLTGVVTDKKSSYDRELAKERESIKPIIKLDGEVELLKKLKTLRTK